MSLKILVDSTMLSLIVEKEPDYLSDFSLSCKATVPRRLTSLLPYMTLMWISSLDENITDENLILDEVSLSSNLSLPAIDETYNGVYTCQLVINLPTAVITKDVDYTINVKGNLDHHQTSIIFFQYSCKHFNGALSSDCWC